MPTAGDRLPAAASPVRAPAARRRRPAAPPAGAAAAGARGRAAPRPRSFLAAEDLTPLKARILLMVALTKTQDADDAADGCSRSTDGVSRN